jgi:hypothetical protein
VPSFGLGIVASNSKNGDFESIATTTVGVGGTSSVTFSSIPQTYSHLQIRMIGRVSNATVDENVLMQFNGNTASDYSLDYFYGTGTVIAGGNATNYNAVIPFRITGANSSANMFGVGVADILDYTNTSKFKTMLSLTGHDQNGSGLLFLFSGNWRSTTAITSLTIYPQSLTNFVQYSSFALYGIKA